MSEQYYEERGYLDTEYRVFHILDTPTREVPSHYHEFIKIFVLVSGNVNYSIEGREYELHPYDIVLVNAGEIHRPIPQSDKEYERIIIYLSTEFMEKYSDYKLMSCFDKCKNEGMHVIRQNKRENVQLADKINKLTDDECGRYESGELLQRCRLIEYLILLNNVSDNRRTGYIEPVSQDENVIAIMEYINNNLTSALDIETIAKAVHLNRSYLMHRFKAETGYTIKEYITEKRLFLAGRLMKNDIPMTEVCYKSGFTNYSSFYRAYVEKYGQSPKKSV